jgi:hypothetical protein
MVVVLRSGAFRIVIYLDDHEPAHVHVFGDGEAKIDLAGPRVLHQRGMSKKELGRALTLVRENRALLLDAWRRMHG